MRQVCSLLLLIGLLTEALFAQNQRAQQEKWITVYSPKSENPDPVLLGPRLRSLREPDGEGKIFLYLFNKSREGVPGNIIDKLPFLSPEIFIPSVDQYNGDGQELIFTYGENRRVITDVMRSMAFLVVSDPYWIELFDEKGPQYHLVRDTILSPILPNDDEFVVYHLDQESSIVSLGDRTVPFESEFWARLKALVNWISVQHIERSKPDANPPKPDDFFITSLGMELNRTIEFNQVFRSNWESQSIKSTLTQPLTIRFSFNPSEIVGRVSHGLNQNRRMKFQLGFDASVNNLHNKTVWTDATVDITDSQSIFSNQERVWTRMTNITESLSAQGILELGTSVGIFARSKSAENISLRIFLSTSILRGNATSSLEAGSFDYYVTSEMAPGEQLENLVEWGLTNENPAENFPSVELSVTGWRLSVDARIISMPKNPHWSIGMGCGWRSIAFQSGGADNYPSFKINQYKSTWDGGRIGQFYSSISVGFGFN